MCGVVVSHYALHNVSPEGRHGIMTGTKTASYLAEGIIFIYVGMDALDPLKWKVSKFGEGGWCWGGKQGGGGWGWWGRLVVLRRVVVSHYALHNVSPEGRHGIMTGTKTASYLAEGIIFIYVGMDALDPLKWKVSLCVCGRRGPKGKRVGMRPNVGCW